MVNPVSTQNVTEARQTLLAAYCQAQKEAWQCFYNQKYERALAFASYAGAIAWQYPILPSYCDDDLEELLSKIARLILLETGSRKAQKAQQKRIVFYNGQIIDNGALTEQYLDYFMSNLYEVLLIVPYQASTRLGPGIIKKIRDYDHGTLLVLNETKRVKTIQKIYQAVEAFSPDLAFLHLLPNDVEGFSVFSRYTQCLRYYIVHNDHTFWFGKQCADFFLEFRQFGYNLSKMRRGIDSRKLVYLPFYPINNHEPFKGFPFGRAGKIVGLSGAILYKYFQDPTLQYFKQIVRLIHENPNFEFCLAGAGSYEQIRAIKKFIAENKVTGRFHYLGFRRDFYRLVGESDIYFESYPMKGGLAVLFAQNQKKPIVGMGENDDLSGLTEDFFDIGSYRQPMTFDEFYREADRLVQDAASRLNNVACFDCEGRFTKRYFESKLNTIIVNGKDYKEGYVFKRKIQELNDDKMLMRYTQNKDVKVSLQAYRDNSFCLNQKMRTCLRLANRIKHKSPLELFAMTGYYIGKKIQSCAD